MESAFACLGVSVLVSEFPTGLQLLHALACNEIDFGTTGEAPRSLHRPVITNISYRKNWGKPGSLSVTDLAMPLIWELTLCRSNGHRSAAAITPPGGSQDNPLVAAIPDRFYTLALISKAISVREAVWCGDATNSERSLLSRVD